MVTLSGRLSYCRSLARWYGYLERNYVCSACLKSSSTFEQRFLSSSTQRSIPALTDSIRKKVWGTADAPGRVDPYLATSPLKPSSAAQVTEDRPTRQKQGPTVLNRARVTLDPPASAGPQEYNPADTWEGIEWIGGKEWREAQLPPKIIKEKPRCVAAV